MRLVNLANLINKTCSIDKCENESICLMDKFNALNLNFYINDGFEVYQIQVLIDYESVSR